MIFDVVVFVAGTLGEMMLTAGGNIIIVVYLFVVFEVYIKSDTNDGIE